MEVKRDFLKLSGYGLLWVLTSTGCMSKAIETIDNATKAPSESYLNYYQQMGLYLPETEISTSTRTLSVYNATDLEINPDSFTALYKYFENYTKETYQYQLTKESGYSPVRSNVNVVQVEPGNVFLVPRSAGLPPELSQFGDLDAFTYFAPQSETFIRIPDPQETSIPTVLGDFSRVDWVQAETVIEACQSSRYVEVLQPFSGMTPPPELDQRTLAQEGFCNAFNLAIKAKQKGLPFSDGLFAYDFVLPGSDGNFYNVQSYHLNEQQYNELPELPYLVEK